MSQTPSLYIGLMSGTSLDGVDGVLADFDGGNIRTVAAAFTPFPAGLRSELMALQAAAQNELEREALAANGLALCYADCVRQLLPQAGAPVAAVAVHGQTIRHRPELGFTRQTNNPALLAELTGIDVIADFRSRDIAAGALGRRLAEIRLVEQRVQQWRMHGAAGGPGAVLVIGLAQVAADPQIHQDIAWAGIEPGDAAVAMQHADVADPADVHHHAHQSRLAEGGLVEGWYQRRALAAGRDVARAEVGDDVDAN